MNNGFIKRDLPPIDFTEFTQGVGAFNPGKTINPKGNPLPENSTLNSFSETAHGPLDSEVSPFDSGGPSGKTRSSESNNTFS